MKFTREELYRRVWETPVSKLAKEFDISDVGLAKACRKAGIPLPPVGHWAKLAHGKPTVKPPLPVAPNENREVELNPGPFRSSTSDERTSAVPARPVAVPSEAPQVLPPATAATKAKLLKVRPRSGELPFLTCSGRTVFECRIGPASVDRAIRLLAAIEANLPAVGAKLVSGEDCLSVEADGQRLEFRLVELFNRTEVTVKDRYYKGSVSKDFSYTLLGALAFEVTSSFPGRKRWTDGKRASLEDKLGEFLQGLADGATAKRLQAERWEAERKRWAEEARIREREEAHRRNMDAFLERLVHEASTSNQSAVVREYLARVQVQLQTMSGDLSPVAQQWLDTAQQLTARLDPLSRRVDRLLRGVAPEEYQGYFGKPV